MSKIWLHFEPFYKLSKWYKIELDGRTKSALKLVDRIYENALNNREENYDDGSENENAIKAMTNPRNNLSEREVKEEIFGLILAVSLIKFLQGIKCNYNFFRDKIHRQSSFQRLF